MATKRFSELDAILSQNIADDDIIASTDVDEVVSKKIQMSELKKFVFADIFGGGTPLLSAGALVSQLNSYDSGDGTNNLNADLLDSQEGSYYLDYANFTNKPIIFSDLNDMANTGNYVSYVKLENNQFGTLRVQNVTLNANNDKVVNSTLNITADNIPQGTVNRYFTQQALLEALAGGLLDTYLEQRFTGFTETNFNNSVIQCTGNFPASIGNGTDQILNVQFPASFTAGNVIRIYNSSPTTPINLDLTHSALLSTTFSQSGPAEDVNVIRYKIASMDLENGRISPSSNAYEISIYPRVDTVTLEVDDRPILDQFNEEFNITLSLQGQPGSIGTVKTALLIYRQVNSDLDEDYRLYQVIGPKHVVKGFYVDYGNFDWVEWSGKRLLDNTFESMIHVPLLPPSTAQYGWTDAQILSVDEAASSITLTNSIYGQAGAPVNIAHNDSAKINNEIARYVSEGKSALSLNDKHYVVESISLPDNFSLTGVPNITKVIKLPWSGYGPSPSNNVVKLQTTFGASGISIASLDFDGSGTYQAEFSDSSDPTKNYFTNLGTAPDDVLITNSKMTNVIGGGIYANSANNFRMRESEIRDSGVSDRDSYSPLVLAEGTNNIIASNSFQNFSDHIDVSISNKTLITNNLISNCGNGLLIYGSKFLISSPNILIGGANELLPSPDVLNSIYDAVNIDLTEGQEYTSDVYRYQENGFNFDLTDNEGDLNFYLYKLEKTEAGAENLYELITDPDTQFSRIYGQIQDVNGLEDVEDLDPTQGIFQFRIQADNVDHILNNYDYGTLVASNPDHVGLVYVVGLLTKKPTGNVASAGSIVEEIVLTLSEPATFNKDEVITQTGTGASGKVKKAVINSTEVEVYRPNETYNIAAFDTTSTNYISGLENDNSATLYATNIGTPLLDALYKVSLEDYNLAEDDTVQFDLEHALELDSNNYQGKVVSISGTGNTATVFIQFSANIITEGINAGVLKRISEMTIVKGRVL